MPSLGLRWVFLFLVSLSFLPCFITHISIVLFLLLTQALPWCVKGLQLALACVAVLAWAKVTWFAVIVCALYSR